MPFNSRPSAFWVNWLTVVTLGVMVFSLLMVLAPAMTTRGFSLVLYGHENFLSGFGTEVGRYLSFVHAVLGAVMFGWAVALLFIIRVLFTRGMKEAWSILVLSLLTWFIPDTGFSIWSGYWENAFMNLGFALLYAIPLVATYRVFHGTHW